MDHKNGGKRGCLVLFLGLGLTCAFIPPQGRFPGLHRATSCLNVPFRYSTAVSSIHTNLPQPSCLTESDADVLILMSCLLLSLKRRPPCSTSPQASPSEIGVDAMVARLQDMSSAAVRLVELQAEVEVHRREHAISPDVSRHRHCLGTYA